MAIFPGSAIFGEVEPAYEVDHSCRFEQADSAYLSRTPGGAGNTKTWTVSCWIKLGLVTGNRHIMSSGGPSHAGGADISLMVWNPSLQLYMYPNGGPAAMNITTAAEYRDPSAWYHVVFMLDTTQAVEANRAKIWVNGEEPELKTTDYPALNADGAGFYINSTRQQVIAHEDQRWRYEFDGYMSEFYMIDGTNLTASSFGEFNSNNQWVPLASDDVKAAVTFGTNGFFLKFQDSSALGDDTSGEGNDYASTNVVASDQTLDVPTNNFCTLDPNFAVLQQQCGSITYSEGNLGYLVTSGGSGYGTNYPCAYGTIAQTSGKWYAEFLCQTAPGESTVEGGPGVSGLDNFPTSAWNFIGGQGSNCLYVRRGELRGMGQDTGGYATFGDNDIISVAMDLDNLKCYWAKNNTWITIGGSVGVPTSGATGTGALAMDAIATSGPYTFMQGTDNTTNAEWACNFGSDSSFAGNRTAQNNQDDNDRGDFYYTPPSGYLALCTDNLSAPEIAKPGQNSNSLIWTGDGATRSMTGLGLAPDFTWIKQRSGTQGHTLYDSVRGATEYLSSNTTADEDTLSEGLTSFDSDGWTMGDDGANNGDTETYVGWNWKAGGAPTADNSAGAGATPTAGSVKIDGSNLGSALAGTIAATRLSANTTAGFSIVKYVGTGANATVAHGLGVAPDLVMVKSMGNTFNWVIYSRPVGATKQLNLNLTAAEDPQSSIWQDTDPSSTVFTIGTEANVNTSTDDLIAYCFASIEGYSKVGSYTGNGNADGTFIYTGFKPAYVLTKQYNTTNNWYLQDDARNPYNSVDKRLNPNLSDAEYSGTVLCDYLSNGFKIRHADGSQNASGGSYLYLAFAESPFKYSNAR